MKNLLIGLGGAGNNIIKLLDSKLNNNTTTLSIQKDLQLIAFSNANFTLNIKNADFIEKFNTILDYSDNVCIIVGLGGSFSILHLNSIIDMLNMLKKDITIFAIMPSKHEGLNKMEKSKTVLNNLLKKEMNLKLFDNYDLVQVDKEIINEISKKLKI